MNLSLRVGSKNNSCIRETQENSIEIPLQSSLPYILLPMVCAHYCAPYPKWPCVEHEVNMCCPCCITSLVLNLSSSHMVDLVFLFHSLFLFLFLFYFSIFLFLEQLGSGWIGHAVTLVTTWWCSHKTDHETWENLVEDSRTDDVI